MRNLDEFIFEKQLEDIYENLLNEDFINEGFIRNALRRAWAWLKSKFRLRRRKYNPYMSDYLARHAEHDYDDETYDDTIISTPHKTAANITKKKTIDRLLDNSKIKNKIVNQGQTLSGAELFDDNKKMCGVLLYAPYEDTSKTKRFTILGLECLKLDDPELYKLLIKIANNKKCVSPMYVAKTEYLQNKSYYEKQGFKLVDDKKQTNLFYAYKEY